MIRKLASVLVIAAAVLLVVPALAQEKAMPEMTAEQKAMMEAWQKAGTPGAEHKRMAESAGTYDMEVKSWHDPSGAPEVSKGTAVRKMVLDGRVMMEEVSSSMMGQPFTGHGMHGFDNVTGKHWSTWTDSMSTGLMVSEGTCDPKGACTFTGSMNDPMTKKPMQSRMTLRWTSPTTQLFEMYGPGPDGKEVKMMEIVYTKK